MSVILCQHVNYNWSNGSTNKRTLQRGRFSWWNTPKTPIFALQRWERRYQKIGTVTGVKWRLVLLYHSLKYNRSNGGNFIKSILRPLFVFPLLKMTAFSLDFRQVKLCCGWVKQGTLTSKGLFVSVIASSTISPVAAPSSDHSIMAVSAGKPHQKAIFAHKSGEIRYQSTVPV